ncbi:MAG TPA: hypothetical protein VFB06_37660 [Streptosporangiaceae bacterium]|nr:hypothetical protein [Streptosporangiaceae bacterium]
MAEDYDPEHPEDYVDSSELYPEQLGAPDARDEREPTMPRDPRPVEEARQGYPEDFGGPYPAPSSNGTPQPTATLPPPGGPGRGVIDFYNGQDFRRVNTLDPYDPAFQQAMYPGHVAGQPGDPLQMAIHSRVNYIRDLMQHAAANPMMWDHRTGQASPALQKVLQQGLHQIGQLVMHTPEGGKMAANLGLMPQQQAEFSPQQRQALTKIEGAQQQLMQEYAQGNIDQDTFRQAMALHQRSREAVGPPRQVQQQQPTAQQLVAQRVHIDPQTGNGFILQPDGKMTHFAPSNAQRQPGAPAGLQSAQLPDGRMVHYILDPQGRPHFVPEAKAAAAREQEFKAQPLAHYRAQAIKEWEARTPPEKDAEGHTGAKTPVPEWFIDQHAEVLARKDREHWQAMHGGAPSPQQGPGPADQRMRDFEANLDRMAPDQQRQWLQQNVPQGPPPAAQAPAVPLAAHVTDMMRRARAEKDPDTELAGMSLLRHLKTYPGGLMTMPPDARRSAVYALKQLAQKDPNIKAPDYKDVGVTPPQVIDRGTQPAGPYRMFSPGTFPWPGG